MWPLSVSLGPKFPPHLCCVSRWRRHHVGLKSISPSRVAAGAIDREADWGSHLPRMLAERWGVFAKGVWSQDRNTDLGLREEEGERKDWKE